MHSVSQSGAEIALNQSYKCGEQSATGGNRAQLQQIPLATIWHGLTDCALWEVSGNATGGRVDAAVERGTAVSVVTCDILYNNDTE